jgi:hypothetical protein
LNDGKVRHVRPLRLDGLTLTNMNNNKGQKPITNRDPIGSTDNPQPTGKQSMKLIAGKLGLSADASEESILTEVAKLQNRVTELTPLEETNKKQKNRLQLLEKEQIDGLMDAYGVAEEKVRNRIKPILEGIDNRDERANALVDLGYKLGDGKAASAGRVINRADGKNPGSASQAAAGNERELAQKAEAEILDYKVRNRCTYADARNAIRTAKPELFGITK